MTKVARRTPAQKRRIVLARYDAGMEMAEIARSMRIPLCFVQAIVRLHRPK